MSVQSVAASPAVTPSVVGSGAGSGAVSGGMGVSAAAPSTIATAQAANSESVQQAAASPSAASVKQAVEELNHFVAGVAPDLQFSMDQSSHTPVVRLVDNQTDQVIMQFPSQDALSIAHAIDRFMKQGALLKEKA